MEPYEENYYDIDNICSITNIELLQDGKVVKTIDGNERSFTTLSTNTTYDIRVNYTYDCGNHNDNKDFMITKTITTNQDDI